MICNNNDLADILRVCQDTIGFNLGDAFSKSLSIVPGVTNDRSWRQFRIYIKFHLVPHIHSNLLVSDPMIQ